MYFIVDCFHHRILYNDNLTDDIVEWTTIDYEFAGCHSIASDGNIFVVDNTGRNEVLVFDSTFKRVQTIPNVGHRPHKVIFKNNRFYVLSSGTQTVYCYKVVDNRLVLEFSRRMDFMGYAYCRSVKIIDGHMYFATDTPNVIYKVNYLDDSFNLVESYQLPSNITFLVDVDYYNGHFYVTNYTDINKSTDLVNFTSVYTELDLQDIPYFTSVIDGKLFFTEVGEIRNAIHSVDYIGTHTVYYSFDGLDISSERRREMYPR